jgi:hypothetical protein
MGMDEALKTLYDFGDEWDILKVEARRSAPGCDLNISIAFSHGSETQVIELLGCKDYWSVEALLEADRVRFSNVSDSQLEYGRIVVECFSDAYGIFKCDELA